jgi:aminoglycoside phosphotransferase
LEVFKIMRVEVAICEYLKDEIFPQIAPPPYGEIEIVRLACEKPLYLCIEKDQKITVIAKSFKTESIPTEDALLGADKEYLNLRLLRERFGMNDGAVKVVAPLGANRGLSAFLITEKAPGQTLDYYILRAIHEQQRQELFDKLRYLAGFFVRLHCVSETKRAVSIGPLKWYLERLLDTLTTVLITPSDRAALEKYAAAWWDRKEIFTADREVIVHGDATPTNFLFDNGNITAIDLENMKWADRCLDLGFIAAELKHHFMWRMHDGWAAEPFIGHFLWEYAVHYGDTTFFHTITRKIPLYMAIGLLRIARNGWLDEPYRKGLVAESQRCLKYGL